MATAGPVPLLARLSTTSLGSRPSTADLRAQLGDSWPFQERGLASAIPSSMRRSLEKSAQLGLSDGWSAHTSAFLPRPLDSTASSGWPSSARTATPPRPSLGTLSERGTPLRKTRSFGHRRRHVMEVALPARSPPPSFSPSPPPSVMGEAEQGDEMPGPPLEKGDVVRVRRGDRRGERGEVLAHWQSSDRRYTPAFSAPSVSVPVSDRRRWWLLQAVGGSRECCDLGLRLRRKNRRRIVVRRFVLQLAAVGFQRRT